MYCSRGTPCPYGNMGETMTDKEKIELFSTLIHDVSAATRDESDPDAALQRVCDVLEAEVPHYDWVGFYLVNPEKEHELVLGPFTGAPTEHVRIAFGQGICGQAAATKKTFIVPDVSKETTYLACSPAVKSEIVLPILKQGEVMGELDIDSHIIDAFSEADRAFLLKVCYAVSRVLQRAQAARKR
jgi:L-methionine (R)-S-oxide reductase